MAEKRTVTLHRDGSPIHAEFAVEAVGAHTYKIVSRHTADTIRFHQSGPGFTPGVVNGLTRELLIAVALDSLIELQAGALPCPENAEAIKGLAKALLALQRRTTARLAQGVEGKMAAHAPQPPPNEDVPAPQTVGRVTLDAGTVTIGEVILSRKELASGWKYWSSAEAALKQLRNPAATAAEIDLLGQVPTNGAARNGYSEMRQALGQSR